MTRVGQPHALYLALGRGRGARETWRIVEDGDRRHTPE
jgi:hypothetical protein